MKLDFEAGGLRPIGAEQMELAQRLAAASPRQRAIVRYHEHAEAVQRMLNAIDPDSYVRPHKHEDPDKVEVFVALRGSARVVAFDDDGTIRESVEIRAAGPCSGVEVPPRTWHGLIALEPGTLLYEVIEGPFGPASHKCFAPWAPAEGSPDAAAYHGALREQLGLGRPRV